MRQLCAERIEPHVAGWFERGRIDDVRGLAKELGALGVLGMHLEGYGCAGMSATEYGLACLELEAADSGIRCLVSVQGSLAMFTLWRWGSAEQKAGWLPRLDGVRLPADGVLPGVTGLKGPLSCLNEARYGITWGAIGAARSALAAALSHAGDRVQFGRPIAGFQLTQQTLHLGRREDAGELRPEQVSLGKLNNAREVLEICRAARTILGANGISLEYPVIRHANNLEPVLPHEGTVEMHTLVVGQAMSGQAAFR
ncbi:acyl-CoA dehydrogenase family protein [Amycolatopsis thermoflava]|uniref:acyl-CoA dehydrogenase family protein n=1 Tax=Amycolatopsis thermoflava TaxID=84480 RepID=UPI000F4B8B9C|nr:acyl-CoA dehydrogenase family protein [Amycolatopsis thermoflava]